MNADPATDQVSTCTKLHPDRGAQKKWYVGRLLILLFAFAFVYWLFLWLVSNPLKTDSAPWGMLSFALAGNAAAQSNMLATWDRAEQLGTARLHLYLDFGFVFLYSSALALSLAATAHRLNRGCGLWRWIGGLACVLVWFQLIAGMCDIVENLFSLHVIAVYQQQCRVNESASLLIYGFAAAKFLLVAFWLLFYALALVYHLVMLAAKAWRWLVYGPSIDRSARS